MAAFVGHHPCNRGALSPSPIKGSHDEIAASEKGTSVSGGIRVAHGNQNTHQGSKATIMRHDHRASGTLVSPACPLRCGHE